MENHREWRLEAQLSKEGGGEELLVGWSNCRLSKCRRRLEAGAWRVGTEPELESGAQNQKWRVESGPKVSKEASEGVAECTKWNLTSKP